MTKIKVRENESLGWRRKRLGIFALNNRWLVSEENSIRVTMEESIKGAPAKILSTFNTSPAKVMALKTLPDVAHMGDTTNGAHGTMIGRELSNGWFYSLVPQETVLFDGQSYEGIGLAPDIYFQNSMEDIQSGKDALLEAAIQYLN